MILFITVQFINVIISTIKSILTVSGSKFSAALINTISYTFGIVVVKMITDFSFLTVVLTTIFTNFIGVFIAKWFLEKIKKDRLWNMHVVVKDISNYEDLLQENDLTYTLVHAKNNRVIFNIYLNTKDETDKAKCIFKDTKYSILETI